ncbi:hypothetical protein OESDEN_13134 [Oesophagostomum dentatum]|uniref:Uncharacterized protein n=1 Tax=Oesophagostomum dentatum TaxID=61180 RepID=A0A0B1SP42_OESDE|nr:hypothetical protein OESDEN_13134 [Oesophagostomum dentatum]
MQCASPTLQTQWQRTGLPRQPANLPFHSSCESAATYADTSAFAASTCATGEICFEMVIPMDNQYSYVRGCHKDFIESAVTTQQITQEKCTYSLVTDQKITKDGEDTTKTYQAFSVVSVITYSIMSTLIAMLQYTAGIEEVAAVRFVKNADGPTVLNAILTKSSLETDTVITTALTGCSVAPQTNCVKHIFYQGTGRNDKYSTCSGAYCSSFEGRLNGELVKLDCDCTTSAATVSPG